MWRENPLLAVPHWALAAVDLWLDCRRMSGPYGARMLPCAGGYGDQPAALMDAFRLFDMLASRKEE